MYKDFSSFLGHFFFWLIPLVIFDIVLKAMSLWRSSKRGEKGWFIALFVLNTLGLLPLVYLLTHPESKPKKK